MFKIRNRWFHYFDSLMLDHDNYRVEDFENIIDIMTQF